MLQSKENGFGPTRTVVTPDLPKVARKALVADACKHYKADRIAWKRTRGTQSAARLASKRPGPVIQRLDLVREMNEQLKAA
jgi:hypothetical protein